MDANPSLHVDTPPCTPMHFQKSHVVEPSGMVAKPIEEHGERVVHSHHARPSAPMDDPVAHPAWPLPGGTAGHTAHG